MAAKFPLGAMLIHFSFHIISFFALLVRVPLALQYLQIFESNGLSVAPVILTADCRHARRTAGNKFSCVRIIVILVVEIVSYHLGILTNVVSIDQGGSGTWKRDQHSLFFFGVLLALPS